MGLRGGLHGVGQGWMGAWRMDKERLVRLAMGDVVWVRAEVLRVVWVQRFGLVFWAPTAPIFGQSAPLLRVWGGV